MDTIIRMKIKMAVWFVICRLDNVFHVIEDDRRRDNVYVRNLGGVV